jgi:WD40 repeat protein
MAATIDFEKATLAWSLPWDADWITSVRFLGPTRRLAAGNLLGQILIWDLPDKPGAAAPNPVRRLDGHTNAVTRLHATADGRWLLSSSYDHTIRYWDMEAAATGSAAVALNARTREDLIRRSSSKVPPLVEVKVELQPSARALEGHRDWIVGMDLGRDDQLIVSGDDAGQVIVWDRAAGKELRRWQIKGWAYAVALAPDNQQVAVSERVPLVFDSGRHAGVRIWNPQNGQVVHDLSTNKEYKEYYAAAAYSPDGKLLALCRGGEVDGNNGKVSLIDPGSGKKLRETNPGHLNGGTDVAFHPDGQHVASCGRDTVVRIWKAGDAKLIKELGKPRGGQFKDWFHAVAFSADGLWVAAADMNGQVHVWSLAAG